MLRDKKQIVERWAADKRLQRQLAQDYGSFLRTLFALGDWFVTLTFRDRCQDSHGEATARSEPKPQMGSERLAEIRDLSTAHRILA